MKLGDKECPCAVQLLKEQRGGVFLQMFCKVAHKWSVSSKRAQCRVTVTTKPDHHWLR